MKRQTDLDKARLAKEQAEQKRDEIREQRPLVESESRWLGVLFAENNLSARFRQALMGE